YDRPQETGWHGWVEDGNGTLVGYLKGPNDASMVTVAEADAQRAGAAEKKASAKKKAKGRQRVETNAAGPDLPKPGTRPTLHQMNAIRMAGAKRGGSKVYANRNEAITATKAAQTEARRRIADANVQVKRIVGEAKSEAAQIVALAKKDADAIRKGARAEASAAG
ncbi:MAG: hypothetical protein DRH08_00170, partial [Deltaproteobacteria bacterium]